MAAGHASSDRYRSAWMQHLLGCASSRAIGGRRDWLIVVVPLLPIDSTSFLQIRSGLSESARQLCWAGGICRAGAQATSAQAIRKWQMGMLSSLQRVPSMYKTMGLNLLSWVVMSIDFHAFRIYVAFLQPRSCFCISPPEQATESVTQFPPSASSVSQNYRPAVDPESKPPTLPK